MAINSLTAPKDAPSSCEIPARGIPLAHVSPAEQQRIIDNGGAIYVPQQIIMLTAGNDDDVHMLCHADPAAIEAGMLGKDAPELTSIQQMKYFCGLPKLAPKGTFFTWYSGN